MAARAGQSKQSKGKKNRKLGRNKTYCEIRVREGRELKNAIRRVRRHLRRRDKNLNDIQNQRHHQKLLEMKP